MGKDEQHGGLTPPIFLASTFERGEDLEYPKGFIYGRASNPTRVLFEQTLAECEGSGDAAAGSEPEGAAFASGMAAVGAIFQASPGAHVLLPDDVYHGTRTALQTVFDGWVTFEPVDFTDIPAAAAAAAAAATRLSSEAPVGQKPRRVIAWLETPSNPLLKVTDITAVAAAVRSAVAGSSGGARASGSVEALVVTDATWVTPAIMRPLELGSDLVLHSTTKYLGGHSDLVGGVVVGAGSSSSSSSSSSSKEAAEGEQPPATSFFEDLKHVQAAAGAVQAPFDCWLALRGMRSLGARMRMHCENAMEVAEFLDDHPAVHAVYYPGLPRHPGHATMAEQCHDESPGFGGMLSFQPKGGEAAAVAVAAALNVFRRGTSLGGTESLVEHRRSIEPPDSATPNDLLRLSVGLESSRDLIRDLNQALGAVGKPRRR